MLFIRQVKHLALALKTSDEELVEVLGHSENHVQRLKVNSNGKVREVLNVTGPLRAFQKLLYRNVLWPKLKPSKYSHGGVAGRSILTNVGPHIGQRYLFATDISSFYPSIHHSVVYRLFLKTLGCSPDVSRLLTKLTTFDYHLALGLITSPILANQLLAQTDSRIGSLCERNGMSYTRFVDDISISAPFDLQNGGFAKLVERILNEAGFQVNRVKHRFGTLADGLPITKIRIVSGHPDVEREYVKKVWRELCDASRLCMGQDLRGVFQTQAQILGKIQFIAWVNPRRKRRFIQKYKSIHWSNHEEMARQRGILTSPASS